MHASVRIIGAECCDSVLSFDVDDLLNVVLVYCLREPVRSPTIFVCICPPAL